MMILTPSARKGAPTWNAPPAMKEVTLCFPLTNCESPVVLLGLKKRGFGQGKYVGFGGKIEAGETVEEATVRELEEETGLRAALEDLEPAGRLTFLFPAQAGVGSSGARLSDQALARRAAGDRGDATAMVRHRRDSLFTDVGRRRDWLPWVLAGEVVYAVFWYGDDNATVAAMEFISKPWKRQDDNLRYTQDTKLAWLTPSDAGLIIPVEKYR